MGDTRIVRNERKIRSTIHNAAEFEAINKDYGSFQKYIGSFGKKEKELQVDLQKTFQHMGWLKNGFPFIR